MPTARDHCRVGRKLLQLGDVRPAQEDAQAEGGPVPCGQQPRVGSSIWTGDLIGIIPLVLRLRPRGTCHALCRSCSSCRDHARAHSWRPVRTPPRAANSLKEPLLRCNCHRLRAGVRAQLVEDGFGVLIDRIRREVEVLADGLAGKPLGHQPQHLRLALRQEAPIRTPGLPGRVATITPHD